MRTRVREAARAAKELHKQPAPRGGIKTRSCAQKPEKGPALPFPIHWGEHLLQRRADFLLPEYFLEEEEAVRARLDAKAKPEPYREIPRNQYTSRRKLQANAAVCQCKPDSRCRDECMNRLMQYICDPKTCPCGENCTNQRLGVRVPPKCEVVKCGKRGFGLKTKEPLKKGQLVDEYRGEIIDLPEATRRTVNIYKEKGNFYLLDYDAAAGEVLDSGMKGNRTRFANHSCDPNCHMQKWIICGTGEQLKAEFEIGLFASRDIEAGEELTYDYGNMDGEVTDKGTPITCHCGSENCSGVLGGKK
ncbi:SET domain-containing protein, partial [Tilletiaria anomala UBC 951]